MPAALNAARALSMHKAIDCASLRQGITTETSILSCCAIVTCPSGPYRYEHQCVSHCSPYWEFHQIRPSAAGFPPNRVAVVNGHREQDAVVEFLPSRLPVL